MLFSSPIFLFYFLPFFLLLYYLTPNRFKNHVLLFASIVFYSWGGPVFIFVILFTTALDYILVKQIERSDSQKRKKKFLIISLIVNLGLLFSFKYLGFFITNINHLLGLTGMQPIGIITVALPIGISFFTFESLTYVIDVYRGDYKSLNSYKNYFTYILMFPKLIAGPIVPYNKIGWQIEGERKITSEMRLAGFMRFIFGLSKKILIANVLGETIAELYKQDPGTIDTITAWAMSVGYTMQLYFDFSGYSDMAIGLCKMMGFTIPENFNFPYISRSITEFWKRWHISLGNWMRNYLYIPLGGNQGNTFSTYRNLWIVFLISGFWHGAGWNFILWGIYHGFFLVVERLFLNKFLKNGLAVIYTFFIANIGWVLFRNSSLATTWIIYKRMFSFEFSTTHLIDLRFTVVLCFALFLSFSGSIKSFYELAQSDERLFIQSKTRLYGLYTLCLVLFIISSSYLLGQDFNPFIYFRF
jgi:alginate O-acetyltransferase complex protein AlgI